MHPPKKRKTVPQIKTKHSLRELRDIALDCTVVPGEPLNSGTVPRITTTLNFGWMLPSAYELPAVDERRYL